ncbi:hypothetical protein OE88DRAFT_1650200 [Heliocybe sulcata]|uniref:Uncharacterized protein n=1 Tax=Heliocybe sulcata TaxID=5364 RepID=A0A5C3NHF4_9AGAM|nr:hypothetical protein OE88DRAFT_1650200 [Heliocybe sulcata]
MMLISTSASTYSTSAMLATDSANHDGELSPLASYSRSLHDYTLRLWTESRRLAEEKARQRAQRRKQILDEEDRLRAQAPAALPSMQMTGTTSIRA